MRFVVEEFKASPKIEVRPSSKSGRVHQQKTMENSLLEAIVKEGLGTTGVVARTAEDGTVRMKIVVKRENLKQVLHAMKTASSDRSSFSRRPAAADTQASLEQRLCALKRRTLACRSGPAAAWRPRLQSIPEERC